MPKSTEAMVSAFVLASVADYFKGISEVTRLQILQSLRSGPMNVLQLTEATGLGQANLSKHLKMLTQAGILSRQTKGTSAFYEIVDPLVVEFFDLACDRITKRTLQQARSLSQFEDEISKF
ncbi:Transcriptional regulator, ArsR family [Tumidithrix helvetica PCC 7403]|uniref:ArsR/SmtB family transcription factor n=1 Tax=Tumidithrix helvetica TaxID=3457545 RepID=UPI003C833454